LTISEFKCVLKDSLSNALINPIVNVKILNRKIALMGEFRDSATILVDKEHNSLLDMISRAGGFDQYASLKRIKGL